MKSLRFRGGSHSYFGKRNSRASRQQSKIYKGLKKVDTTKYFKKMEREEKLKKIQDKAKKLGHCCCSSFFTCECSWFKDKGECYCAGDVRDSRKWLNYNIEHNEKNI